MDLAYLREHPQHLPTFLTHQRIRETPVPGGVCRAARLTLDDGTSLFAKSWPSGSAPDGFFAAEAAGLRWLAEAGAPVPELLSVTHDLLAVAWIEPGDPSPAAARRLGRELAALHRRGASAFGADWPGFIGPLPLDNTPSPEPWSAWFAARRLAPYLRTSADRGALDPDDVRAVERIIATIDRYAAEEPPARTHGDLWPGNVLWANSGRAWLIDPAAHGGHRETDLANLALFGGAPHLDQVLSAYREVWPLADGWRERIPLHQLHLLLVHTAAFGASYRASVRAAADAVLR
ncbi:fructosamine kinase family protein [Mangrovihabitans endophyticus]|uniref:Fructosamine kinase n=1 Tax=Mangrovihabitans endophyticus TaxID=1751298 RepID=A0A8J3C0M9_9ACTN|nr:fructosamine kinase family protein [Mangrovihabitans endophyticus]GGK93674.1 fructosamine kinase [Mangrovihabitans endophyticus]